MLAQNPTQSSDAIKVLAGDASMILSEPQIVEITGGYKRPADQLAELRRQGFFRARLSRITGRVVLEREHYTTVCQGTIAPSTSAGSHPKVRILKGSS